MTFVPYRKRYKDFLRLDPATGCLEWVGYTDPMGYGKIRYGGEAGYVHRYVWEQEVGPITEGLLLRHSCDNTKCANVEHLSEGTHLDNAEDRDSRGRSGTIKHGNYVGKYKVTSSPTPRPRRPKLSREQVLDIRTRAANGSTYASISRTLDISPRTVSGVSRGILYRELC